MLSSIITYINQIAAITVFCSLCYTLLGIYDVVAFALKLANKDITWIPSLVGSCIEILANSVMLFALTPKSIWEILLCKVFTMKSQVTLDTDIQEEEDLSGVPLQEQKQLTEVNW